MGRQFRLKRRSYTVGTQYEEGPGSACYVVHRDGGTVILWRGECGVEPDAKFFTGVDIALPVDENEEDGGEPYNLVTGQAEYSYVLEELLDGRWWYCNHLHAFRREDDADKPTGY